MKTQPLQHIIRRLLPLGAAGACVLSALVAQRAAGAVLYFDPNGPSPVTAGTYTWDTVTAEWSTSSALTGSLVAWNSADAANFCAGSFTGNITVDVNSAINVAGIFDGNLTPPGCNVTIAGSGSLNFASGAQALGAGGSDGNSVTLLIPVTGGTGTQMESEEDGVNVLNLDAGNPSLGPLILGPNSNGTQPSGQGGGPGGVSFNNNTAFGVGNISSTSATATRQIFTTASGPLTLANGFTLWNGVLSLGGSSTSPVIFTGNTTLPGSGNTATLSVFNTPGNTGASYTFSGVLSGAGNLTLSGTTQTSAANGPGTLILSGANTYTGTTTITTGGTLQLGAANTIATSSSVILAGGTLNGGGFTHANSGTLGLTANSTLDFGGGTMSFANSSTLTWSGILNLADWTGTGSGDFGSQLEIGTSASGLTSAQLAVIEFDGNASTLGDAAIDPNGWIYMIPIPEPSTLVLSFLGGLGILWTIRRRKV